MKEALYYDKLPGGRVVCRLCPHECAIVDGASGICLARANSGGKLFSLVYGRMAAVHLDPIEKKPLYHFHPGSMILSVGTAGCNLRCSHCQNWEISRRPPDKVASSEMEPAAALDLARRLGSIGIAYTYNEPLINFEWVAETSRIFAAAGLKNVLVTNGFVNEEPWKELLKCLDAANIDLKSFDESFYRGVCGGELAPVLRNIETMVRSGKHVEITCLVISGLNDDASSMDAMARRLAALDENMPLHLSRYFPAYKSASAATPVETLDALKKTASKYLKRVYLGNV